MGKVIERNERVKNQKTGKWKNEKKYIANRGYFDSDFLQIDEALELVTSKESSIKESRSYICIATDPIGQNTIKKRLVEHKSDEVLEYNPKAILNLFFQPLPVPSETFTSGFMRRFLIIYIKSNTNAEDIFKQRLSYCRCFFF